MSGGDGAEAAVEFLRALGRYLSTARLYRPDHRAREEAAGRVHAAAEAMLRAAPEAKFSLMPGRVVFGDRPLREMEDWPLAAELAEVGVQRIELERGLERRELASFLRVLADRRSEEEGAEGGRRWPHVGFGDLGIETPASGGEAAEVEQGSTEVDEEARAVGHLHESASEEGRVPVEEAVLVVRSLAVAMRASRRLIAPFLSLKGSDQYTAAHCLNVAVLAMALAEATGRSGSEVRSLGLAGLLHDVGKARLPARLLERAREGSRDEQPDAFRRHPELGCRLLLDSGRELRLAAMVAYEHHLAWDGSGGGYPQLRYDRTPLPETRLVQVCDFYEHERRVVEAGEAGAGALPDRVEGAAGDVLDPQFAGPFLDLLERWDPAAALVEADAEPDPGGKDGG